MKTKFFILASCGLSALVLYTVQSCDRLLDVKPPIDQISAEQIFSSVNTADAALSNLYSEIQSNSLISGGFSGSGALLGTYTDDLISYDVFTQNGDSDLYHNVQGSSNITVKKVWTNAYSEIYAANAIIEGIDKSTAIAENDRKRVRGEALFLRSLVYFYLTQLFGDLPYVTTTDYTLNRSLGKTPAAELLVMIQKDLYSAKSDLSDDYRNPERIYPNRKTAELLLATVLMTRKQYAEAETMLRGIVGSPLYSWQPDLTKTFKKQGKHILWQLKPLKPNDATGEALLYYFASAAPTTYSLTGSLAAAFDPQDLRKQLWIKAITVNGNQYYRSDKYTKLSANTDEYSVVFRLEEAYLLLAEALAEQGKVSEAVPYLNAVRQKAGLGAVPATVTKEELLTAIISENRKEFFTEKGHRFLTLKRAGKLNDLTLTKPNWKEYHQVWPLPFSEIILNPQINPQNNGY